MTGPVPYSSADLDIAIKTVTGEARNQSPAGQSAVAWVIRNRAEWDEDLNPSAIEHEWWGTTIAKVCQSPWQFSCWKIEPDATFVRDFAPNNPLYSTIKPRVQYVFDGKVADLTGGATTYKVRGTKASWDVAVAGHPPRSIGAHDFWRLSPDGKVLPFLDEVHNVE